MKSIYIYLEWYGEESNDDIRQREVGDEAVGDVLHSAGSGHDPHDQRVAHNCYYRYAPVEKGQQRYQSGRHIVQTLCEIN